MVELLAQDQEGIEYNLRDDVQSLLDRTSILE